MSDERSFVLLNP
jgi:hypothetical protein